MFEPGTERPPRRRLARVAPVATPPARQAEHVPTIEYIPSLGPAPARDSAPTSEPRPQAESASEVNSALPVAGVILLANAGGLNLSTPGLATLTAMEEGHV